MKVVTQRSQALELGGEFPLVQTSLRRSGIRHLGLALSAEAVSGGGFKPKQNQKRSWATAGKVECYSRIRRRPRRLTYCPVLATSLRGAIASCGGSEAVGRAVCPGLRSGRGVVDVDESSRRCNSSVVRSRGDSRRPWASGHHLPEQKRIGLPVVGIRACVSVLTSPVESAQEAKSTSGSREPKVLGSRFLSVSAATYSSGGDQSERQTETKKVYYTKPCQVSPQS